MHLRGLFFVFLLVLATGCAGVQPRPLGGGIADLQVFPQNLLPYVPSTAGPLMSEPQQEEIFQVFRARFFAPWEQNATSLTREEAFWGIASYSGKTIYGENKLPRPENWFQDMVAACRIDKFPHRADKAVAVRNTSLRVMPTLRPLFYDFKEAGEGFPFDYFQNSALWAGTPVFVSHSTTDGAWLFCEASYASGWVPAADLAFADDYFIQDYSSMRLAAVIEDNTAVRDADGRFLFLAHVGAVFPLWEEGSDGLTVVVPLAAPDSRAVLRLAGLPYQKAAPMPLRLESSLIARVGNGMMGQTYGWGGLYENRDCSAAVRDLFTPFGLWLPRNSKAQAAAGLVINLSGLDDAAKEKRILTEGLPFGSLLGMPGHIMLYLGERQGRAMVFHNLWGLRTIEPDETSGRYILGRAVITTLTPGKELPYLDPARSLLSRVSSLSFPAYLP